MRDATITAINCTSCGAGLDIYGGGRVRTHICGYCGTTLDADDDYKALTKFTDAPRPDTPFELGMTGEIFGVEFTIIGTLGVEERWGHEHWEWVEHQVYSPTHGYAWLNFEDCGHLTFSRKVRDVPSPAFIDERRVNIAESRPTAMFESRHYTYYESGSRTIYFAEGEFNWIPKANAKSGTVSLASDEYMLTYVETPNEREIEQSRYLSPAPVYASFGAKAPRMSGVHVLEAYKPTSGEWVRSIAAGILTLFCLTTVGQMNASEHLVIERKDVQFAAFPVEIPFTVTNTDRLVRVGLWANVSNSWAEFDVEITDPEDEVLFEVARGVEFYSGYDDGNWTEGSRSTDLTFRPTEPGDYTMTLSAPIGHVDWQAGQLATRARISVTENVSSTLWLLWASGLLALFAALPILRRFVHHRRQWHGSDWTDDDE